MSAPRLLDLFCCAGGAGVGYWRAGFEVTGIDIADQPQYPFTFFREDALDTVRNRAFLRSFDAIHASPPCQAHSPLNAYNKIDYPDLIEPVREALQASGLPYIIENVPQAPLRDPVTLCGAMFDLPMYRHRSFESNFAITPPEHRKHVARCARNGYLPSEGQFMSIHGGAHGRAWTIAAAEAMGTPWMVTDDTKASIRMVCESIPPAYTEFLGEQLMAEATR